MTLRELLRDPFLQTPKAITYRSDFFDYVSDSLDKFNDKVDSLDDDEHLDIIGVKYNPSFIKEIINILVDGLKQCIALYLDGKINEAYIQLNNTMTHERKNFYLNIKQFNFDKQTNFYRIRKQRENILFTPNEMFHIPYESRGIVQNQRFSINGFPSLYLSSNLYTCWEELHRPDLNDFQAIRFRNKVELSVLDLAPQPIPRTLTKEHYRYLLTWPIIFACGIKVRNKNDVFKPEYIIPQLLLQWVRQNDEIDCIRYYSTNVDRYNSASKGDFSNYVFPVKNNEKKGYCSELKGLFRHTEPISWQTYQMATGGQNFIFLEKELLSIDKKISNLEIIKNRPYPYSYSILGKMEHFLDNMSLEDIKF
jgi:hypothetical protein